MDFILRLFPLQICTKIYHALRNCEFGSVDKLTEEFKEKCHKRFKYATIFKSADDEDGDSMKVSNENKYKFDGLGGGAGRRSTENFHECFQEMSVCNWDEK